MKTKRFLIVGALVVGISGTNLCLADQGDSLKVAQAQVPDSAKIEVDSSANIADSAHVVAVYYFYGNVRCETCLKVEAYTDEAVTKGFAEDIKAGRVKWQALNVEKPENEHFRDDFDLITRSVVIADMQGDKAGRFEILDKSYDLLDDKPAFIKYIRDEVSSYLRAEK